ncbi:MAG: tetratricopeptide repeat protein [Candidatus Latescibacterota bacterium]|nr:tetratricopeptide repeat protein [Candidatus Latescibacterota bacterium]
MSDPAKEDLMRSAPYGRCAPLLLLVAGCIVYANSLRGDFIYDDIHSIAKNPDIRSLWPPRWMLPTDAVHEAVNSRPVASFSLALNYALGGLEISGYRLFNLGVHLLCGLALYGVVRRTLGSGETGLAFSCALLWLVHPLQSQCINYIIQRRESLASLFYLLALYSAIRGFDTGAHAWYIGSILSCALGVASKEIVVTAPFAIALYDRVYRSDSWTQVWHRRRFYIGFGAPLLLLLFLIWGDPHGDSVGLERVGVWPYALNQCVAIVHYLQLVVWPHPLLLDYGPPQVLTLLEVAPRALLLLGLMALCGWGLVRYPRQAYPFFWFFALLAPSSSVIPIAEEWAAERRVYLALAGPLVLLLAAAYWALRRGLCGARKWVGVVGLGLVLCVMVALGAETWQRNRDYRSGVAIWQSDLAQRPDNARALRGLAYAHELAGDDDAAIKYYLLALAREPDEPGAHFNLGLIYDRRGEWDAAIRHYARAVELVPDLTRAHNNLGMALKETGRLQEALAHYRLAVAAQPDYVLARKNLASLASDLGELDVVANHLATAAQLQPGDKRAHYAAGNALRAVARWDAAAQSYRRALELDPGFAAAHLNLGVALEMQGAVDAALMAYRGALEARPRFAGAHFNVGRLLEDQGQIDAAIAHYERALELEPDFVEAHSNLGLAHQTRGEITRAVEHFQQALEIRPDYAPARINLEQARRSLE